MGLSSPVKCEFPLLLGRWVRQCGLFLNRVLDAAPCGVWRRPVFDEVCLSVLFIVILVRVPNLNVAS